MKKTIIVLFLSAICVGFLQCTKPRQPEYVIAKNSPGLPDEVDSMIRNSCFQCSSTETELQWYDKFTPANFFDYYHIRNGWNKLAFSKWDSLAPAQQYAKLYFSINKSLGGELSLSSSTAIHKNGVGLNENACIHNLGYLLANQLLLNTITNSFHPKDSLMTVLYGNKLAYNVKISGDHNDSVSALPCSLPWQLQKDEQCFGAEIPKKTRKIERIGFLEHHKSKANKSEYKGIQHTYSDNLQKRTNHIEEMKMENHHHQMNKSVQNIFLSMMDTMMIKMDEVPVTSVPDFDFMAQMIAHHTGAVEMAKYEIRNGKNEEMIHLAKSILAEQTSDIQAMKLLVTQLPHNTQKADKSFVKAMLQSMTVMMENMPRSDKITDTDRGFAMVMIPHHQAAIEMAVALIQHSTNRQVITFAMQLISIEQIEIEQMSNFLKYKP